MTATGVQISALWFYVHRVHMLQKLKNHPDWVILDFLQHMYAMRIETQGRDLHARGPWQQCHGVDDAIVLSMRRFWLSMNGHM